MKKALPTIFIGVLAITVFDILGSIASRQMNFDFSYLSPISFILYVSIAFVVARRTDKKTAVITAGLLGLFEATVGWKLSLLLHPNFGNKRTEFTPAIFAATIVVVTLLAGLLGLLGWWLSTKLLKRKNI
jgi:hypothetical protein